jgi:hypothetical protein
MVKASFNATKKVEMIRQLADRLPSLLSLSQMANLTGLF